jgi:CspA family cold shock protein
MWSVPEVAVAVNPLGLTGDQSGFFMPVGSACVLTFSISEGAATVSDKVTGTVKWFNNAKGYGFISQETGEDVFVHHSAITMTGYRTLNEGQRVQFSVERGPKGLQAKDVEPL